MAEKIITKQREKRRKKRRERKEEREEQRKEESLGPAKKTERGWEQSPRIDKIRTPRVAVG